MFWGLIVFILWTLLYVVWAYNRFIRLDNQSKEGWAGVDVQLKRRYDLIPNLVAVVKAYTNYEPAALERVIQARNKALENANPKDKEAPENDFIGQIKSILALGESYPDLKACEQFLELQRNLAEIEDTLQKARRYYNATARDYNIAIRMFPNNLIAHPLGLREKAFFQITSLEAKNPRLGL